MQATETKLADTLWKGFFVNGRADVTFYTMSSEVPDTPNSVVRLNVLSEHGCGDLSRRCVDTTDGESVGQGFQ